MVQASAFVVPQHTAPIDRSLFAFFRGSSSEIDPDGNAMDLRKDVLMNLKASRVFLCRSISPAV